MNNFVWETPARVYFGRDQVENLPKEAARFGRRVLLAYGGGSIRRIGLYDKVLSLLSGFEVTELSGIEPNPRVESARRGAALCKEKGIELIIAVGGGSVLDCSKLIAAAAFYEGDAWDLVEDSSKAGKCLPIIDVMTLAATGSELDAGAVISNPEKNLKLAFMHGPTFPAVSILDPTYTETVNAWHTACGASDILNHVMEQYFVLGSNRISDGFSETIMRTVVENTPKALANPHDYDARAELMWASSWGCNGLLSLGNTPGMWVNHAIEHELSAFYDITHGAGLAIVAPRWLRRSLTGKTAPRIARFGEKIFDVKQTGDAMSDARAAIAALEDWYRRVGLPATLQEVGITDDRHVAEMARHAMQFSPFELAFSPLTEEDVVAILMDCFKA